jgi:RNA polymerase sigma factor (TIGR02999 family)
MTEPEDLGDVTALLADWRGGDPVALDRLLPLVYADLRKVARAHLRREGAGHSLQATALVHEAYLRFVRSGRLQVENRTHFLAIAARLMRQVLVDHARHKAADKRGGTATVVSLEAAGVRAPDVQPTAVDMLALDMALDELATFDPQQSRVVELKFFAGLTIDEIADALDISTATVEREWAIAKAWLYHRLSGGDSS